MAPPSDDPPEGGQAPDLGEEARRLVAAAQDWARRTFPEPAEHAGAGECLPWCPICQFAHLLRGEHPEVTERMAEAGTALAAAIKALADAAIARAQPGPGDDRGRPRPSPRVQRIRLDDPDED